MEDIYKHIPKNIKFYREQKELSVEEVAKYTGRTVNYISGLENGEKKPSLNTLAKLSDLFDVNITRLIL